MCFQAIRSERNLEYSVLASSVLTGALNRSQDAADRILTELKAIQPEAETSSIRKDLTLLKHIDQVCDEIKPKESRPILLYMTQGTMSLKGRDGQSFDHPLSLIHRLRGITQRLWRVLTESLRPTITVASG